MTGCFGSRFADIDQLLARTAKATAIAESEAARARAASIFEILPHVPEHGAEHLRRQHAGVRVVARAVIAREQRHVADSCAAAMLERRAPTSSPQRRHHAVMRDAAEREDRAQVLHLGDGRLEKIAAGVDLGRRRLVLRRHAAHRVGDAAIDQRQAVVGPRLVVAAREAEFAERLVEQVAGIVAGEGPAGAVGALQAGREADDQQRARRRGPNEGTGALNQSGSFARHSLRKATRRGQSGQSRPGLPAAAA